MADFNLSESGSREKRRRMHSHWCETGVRCMLALRQLQRLGLERLVCNSHVLLAVAIAEHFGEEPARRFNATRDIQVCTGMHILKQSCLAGHPSRDKTQGRSCRSGRF